MGRQGAVHAGDRSKADMIIASHLSVHAVPSSLVARKVREISFFTVAKYVQWRFEAR